MTRYVSFDPKVELNGRTVTAFLLNLNTDEMHDLLVKYGLENVDPTRYYNLQSLLDLLSEISENTNNTENMVAIGMAAGNLGFENRPAQYQNATAAEWLRAYCEEQYPTRQRGGYAGEIGFECAPDENHLRITAHTPYPDDIMYGVFYAYVRACLRQGQSFVLLYDDTITRREFGGEKTIYHVVITPR